MKRQLRGFTLALAMFVALASLAACSANPTAEQSTAQPATPSTSQSPAQPREAASPVSETQAGEIPANPLAAKLQGLDLDEFFEVSWRELSLRDPEAVLADGLADVYGLEGANLTNISDAYTRENYEMYATVLELLRGYNRAELTPEQQVSYDVYAWYLDDLVREQEFMYYDYPATFYPVTAVHAELIHFFTDLHPIADKEDAQDYVARLRQVDTKFEQLMEGLKLREEAGIVPPRFAIQWAQYDLRNLAQAKPTHTPFYQTFKEKVDSLENIGETEKQGLLKDAEQAIEESVLPAYQAVIEYLEHQESVATAKDGVWQFERGDEYYAHLLRHYTTTDMTADEIHELGQQELERIHAEMRAIFDELGYPQGESLPELFNRVAQDSGYVEANEILETYESLIEGADQSLDPAFDIRPRASVVVVQSSIKGMYVSAATDGSRPGAFHAGPGDSREEYYAMPTLAYHEAIPGHHFQIALAQEADLPTFRNMIGFSGFAEGWALYAERLASELGWYEDDPYGDLGRLQAESFRAARLVVDTGIHAKQWEFDKAEKFFIENTGYDAGDAVSSEIEIARYIVWPAQATAYKVGMLKILELRQRAMDQLGDQFDLKEFHNVVLRNGSMPLEVLEQVVNDYVGSAALKNADQPAIQWPTEGWPTSTPEEQGMDSEMLADMLEAIQERGHGIDSVTVIRHGHLVTDATVYPFKLDSKHVIHSCTKSIVSALTGIAIEQGYIESVDERVLGLLPGRLVANLDANKEAMTLEHLLTMASGLECRDSYLYRWRGLEQMRQSDDWVKFMLELPMAEAPGTRFEYCNGASFLLSAIIQETTGMSALAFAEQHLFRPLGITEVEWPANAQGITIGWGELRMKPHDMAKIGHLFLNEGLWEGEQVVPSAWVKASTRKHIPATLQDGYGYQWWVDDSGYYMALGYAGQFIFVIPDLDMVVAFTSDLNETDFYVPQELLTDYILPAARSSGPLPDKPSGVARLESRIEALANH